MNKKLLFIRFWASGAVKSGGEQLTDTNFSYLSTIFGQDNIDTMAMNTITSPSLKNRFYEFVNFCKGYHKGLTADKLQQIISKAVNYDYVYIDRSVFGLISQKLKQHHYKGQIITFFHNCEYLYYKDRFQTLNPLKFLVCHSVFKNEKAAIQYSDHLIALNARDDMNLIKYYQKKADHIIPISMHSTYVPDSSILEQDQIFPLTCLFIGSYFPANSEGILWFIKNVLPYVNIKLLIVGKDMKKLSPALPTKLVSKIEIVENVPNLKPYYENADLAVFPIFKGSGMKVKTCEAMMYGKYIIGTRETFEGYDIDFEQAGALANNADEFIRAITLFEKHQTKRFNPYTFNSFKEKYASDIILQKFKDIL